MATKVNEKQDLVKKALIDIDNATTIAKLRAVIKNFLIGQNSKNDEIRSEKEKALDRKTTFK